MARRSVDRRADKGSRRIHPPAVRGTACDDPVTELGVRDRLRDHITPDGRTHPRGGAYASTRQGRAAQAASDRRGCGGGAASTRNDAPTARGEPAREAVRKWNAARAEQVDVIIDQIKAIRHGAFAPLSQHPIVAAVLIPTGGSV